MNTKNKILIVDDEPSSILALSGLLKKAYDVTSVDNVDDALAFLQTNPSTAVLVTDQRMPKKNGTELLSETKDRLPQLVRVLMTGYSDLNDAIDAVNQGTIYKYVKKPFDPERTLALIQDAVDYHNFLLEEHRIKSYNLQKVQEKTCHAMENYTAWISHHLNNGLQTVYTFVSMAQDKFKNGDESEASFAKLAKVYVEQVNSIIRTLHQIYAQGLSGFSKVPLKMLLQFEDAALSEKMKSKKIHLKMNVANPDLEMMANPTAIQEALRKLVLNSVEASSDGGVIEISAAAHQSDGYPAVMFEVRDFGFGIEPELKEKLFYPFLKLGSNTLEPKGLGLSFVQAVVARHGGDVMVESKLGAGTTITFSLPVIQEEKEASHEETLEDIKKDFKK